MKAGTKPPRYSEEFEAFWNLYPRKREKQAASKTLSGLLKKDANLEHILQATRNYAAKVAREGTPPNFMKLATTFLNVGRWEEFIDGDPDAAPEELHFVPLDDDLDSEGRAAL